MRVLSPEKSVCAWCFAHHEREVHVDRTELKGKSLSERQVMTGMLKIAVAGIVILGSVIYIIIQLVSGYKTPTADGIADGTGKATGKKATKEAAQDAAGGPAAQGNDSKKQAANGANNNNGKPGENKPGTPGGPSSVTSTAGAAEKADGSGNGGTSSASSPDSKEGTKAGAKGATAQKKPGAPGDPAKPGDLAASKEKEKEKEKDPNKADQASAPFKRGEGGSADETIKKIEKMIPKTAKKKGPENSQDDSPEDDQKPDNAAVASDSSEPNNPGGPKKSSGATQQAGAMLSQVSSAASKNQDKLAKMAGVASALTEVVIRLSPKVDISKGVQHVRIRHNSAATEGGDISLDGGKGKDVWDQLQEEAGVAGSPSSKTGSGARPDSAQYDPNAGEPAPGSLAAAQAALLKKNDEKYRTAKLAKAGYTVSPNGNIVAKSAVLPLAPPKPITAATAASKQTELNTNVIYIDPKAPVPAAAKTSASTGIANAIVIENSKPPASAPATALPPGAKPAQTELHANQPIIVEKNAAAPKPTGQTELNLGKAIVIDKDAVKAKPVAAPTPAQ